MSPASADLRRRVPAVEHVLRLPGVAELEARFGRPALLREVRARLDALRALAARGEAEALEEALGDLRGRLAERLEHAGAPSLVPVVNATGVVIHTNLGRAPLSPAAAERVALVARSYSNLELDLESGGRGDREVHAETRLRRLLGAEATVVVNNNAAAVLLAVNTLAEGREVIVSRGELVEIGGSFRIPDVIGKGGARLREVGTTNRTRLADYRAALGPETGLVLKVHPSNFRVVGFTESVPLRELVELSRTAGVPLAEDLGSGLVAPLPPPLQDEPTIAQSLEAGVDVVTFSGDKLLGGPQAGLVAGRRSALDAMRRNPLYRALRVDKMTLAALDVVLADHEAGRTAEIPALCMLVAGAGEVRAAAFVEKGREACAPLRLSVVEGASAVGGGAAPTVEVATTLVAVEHPGLGPDALASALRAGTPPVMARIAEDRLLLDLRTVAAGEEAVLLDVLAAVARGDRR